DTVTSHLDGICSLTKPRSRPISHDQHTRTRIVRYESHPNFSHSQSSSPSPSASSSLPIGFGYLICTRVPFDIRKTCLLVSSTLAYDLHTSFTCSVHPSHHYDIDTNCLV